MVPPLTSVRKPRSAMVEAGAQMLLTVMREETPERNAVDLGFELRVRDSTLNRPHPPKPKLCVIN